MLYPIPYIPSSRSIMVPQASNDLLEGFSYPVMTRKPRWWWRIWAQSIASPSVMDVCPRQHIIYIHFWKPFESWTFPFLEAVGRLSRWFFLAHFVLGYLCIVRRQQWLHFFLFHVVMKLVLEIALHVIGALNRATPGSVYWGKIGMHFWTAFFSCFLFTVLVC